MSLAGIHTPPIHPDSTRVLDTAATGELGIDNGKAGFASMLSGVEDSCRHLAARRKMILGGTCTPVEIDATGGSVTKTWFFDGSIEPYTADVLLSLVYVVDGSSGIPGGTVTLTTTLDAASVTIPSAQSPAYDYTGDLMIQVSAQFGSSAYNDMGVDGAIDVEVAMTGGKITVMSMVLEPQPVEGTITVY